METLHINTDKEASNIELEAIKQSFKELNPNIDSNRIRLSEGMLPLIVEFSVTAIAGGILWDLVKSSIQSLISKEGKVIKRKITINVLYKRNKIVVSKDNIKIFDTETIVVSSLDEAVEIIDNQDKDIKDN